MDGFPILTAIIAVPAVAALVIALLPRSRGELVRPVAVAFTAIELALTISLLASFETGEAGFQFTSFHMWIEEWGIAWNLGVDGQLISAWPPGSFTCSTARTANLCTSQRRSTRSR